MRLGVNVDHVATLRNARGGSEPDVSSAARAAFRGGARGITVHLREDRRHIRDEDVARLASWCGEVLNLEMAATTEMEDLALRYKVGACCIVPERREEVTTESGLRVLGREEELGGLVRRLSAGGIRTAFFVDPEQEQVEASARCGVRAVELHTGSYARACERGEGVDAELGRLRASARAARGLGLRVHAGHGLDVRNVGLAASLCDIEELNVGHALVGRSVYMGLEEAVREFLLATTRARVMAGCACEGGD